MTSVETRVIRRWLRSPPKPRGPQAYRQRPPSSRIVHDLLVVGAKQVLDAGHHLELPSGPLSKALRDSYVNTRPGWQHHRRGRERREVPVIALAGPRKEEASGRIPRGVVFHRDRGHQAGATQQSIALHEGSVGARLQAGVFDPRPEQRRRGTEPY